MFGTQEGTQTLHKAGTLVSEKRALWRKKLGRATKGKNTFWQCRRILVQVRRREAALKDSFKEWWAINSEAEVVLEAQKLQEGKLRQSFGAALRTPHVARRR